MWWAQVAVEVCKVREVQPEEQEVAVVMPRELSLWCQVRSTTSSLGRAVDITVPPRTSTSCPRPNDETSRSVGVRQDLDTTPGIVRGVPVAVEVRCEFQVALTTSSPLAVEAVAHSAETEAQVVQALAKTEAVANKALAEVKLQAVLVDREQNPGTTAFNTQAALPDSTSVFRPKAVEAVAVISEVAVVETIRAAVAVQVSLAQCAACYQEAPQAETGAILAPYHR